MIQKKEENGEKYVTATTEAEFHEALNRGSNRGEEADAGTAARSGSECHERGRGHRGGDRRGGLVKQARSDRHD